MFSLSVAAAKVGFGIRLAYVESVFKRDVHSFDNIDKQSDHNGTDTTSGVDDIESGIGEKLGIVVQMISTIVTAFAVAFSKQWKLTLVVSTVIPVTVIAVVLTVIVEVVIDKRALNLQRSAEQIASEALANIRDVLASTAEDNMIRKYSHLIESALNILYHKAPALGIQYSFEYFFMFCGYSLSFWYGSKLYSQGEAEVGDLITYVSFLSAFLSYFTSRTATWLLLYG
jgi:ATP-binding cassette subfamily B (MDR/TAP) protein 1